jgi:putative transposase
MPIIVDLHKTYKYRLYTSKQDYRLHDLINVAGIIWNHITVLQRRYYKLFGKHLDTSRMKAHIARLRMKTKRYHYWRQLGSQAVQQICERHEAAYDKFFAKQAKPPRRKKVKQYRSFTLKQSGWKLEVAQEGKAYRRIRIDKTTYKFVYHRPMNGKIKTVTIKRDAANRLWICFSVVETVVLEDRISVGKIGGFDFGLQTFLTADNGRKIENPQFFKQDLPRIRNIQKCISKKVKDSTNQREGYQHLARRHIRVADKRRDFHFQLAHELCDDYDVLVFEDLNIAAMKRLWGRKVSDLGFTQFTKIMEWVAYKRGKRIIYIDRWERTTGICSHCKHQQPVGLKERIFCCAKCGFTLDRDHNAAINIRESGHRLMLP